MNVLGDRFYRLEVHSLRQGIAVEESTTLRALLDQLARSLEGPPRILRNDGGRVTLEGTTLEGDDVRIVLSYYQRVTPPGDGRADDGWAALDPFRRDDESAS
jgi:hypothetical protein